MSLSFFYHHPNAHRSNANTHSITNITVILGLFQTDEAVTHHYKFSQNEFASRYSTKSFIYTRHVFFAHLSFQTHDATQPTKNTNFRPIPDPTQPNPTRGSTQPMDNSRVEYS